MIFLLLFVSRQKVRRRINQQNMLFEKFKQLYCGFEISDFGNIKTSILYRNIVESLFYFRNQKSEIRHHYYTASDNDENVNSRIFIGGTI